MSDIFNDQIDENFGFLTRYQHIPADLDSATVKTDLSHDVLERLAERMDISLRDIEKMLQRNDLGPEQRQRLLNVAQGRFFGGSRAGLGFRTQEIPGERGVGVQNVVAGFPAAAVLQAGDRIMEVDGKPLADFAAIRPIIVSRDPGDILELTILRGGETLKLKVELGHFNRLDNTMLDYAVLAAAWELRTRGLREVATVPIASGLTTTQWVGDDADRVMRVLEVGPRDLAGEDGRSGVVMGGEPRGGQVAADSQWQEGGIQIHPGFGRAPQFEVIAQLEQQRQMQIARRQAIDSRLALPEVPAEERRQLEQQRMHLQLEIRRLELLVQQRRFDEIRRDR